MTMEFVSVRLPSAVIIVPSWIRFCALPSLLNGEGLYFDFQKHTQVKYAVAICSVGGVRIVNIFIYS